MLPSPLSYSFKIDRPNYEDGAGPDIVLIPLPNLPTYVRQATLTLENGNVRWYNLQRCPAQGTDVLWSLQANAITEVVSPTYTFELSITGNGERDDMRLVSTLVTGTLTVSGDEDAYNANLFVRILEHRPKYLSFVLERKDMIPIVSTPVNLSMNLHFR